MKWKNQRENNCDHKTSNKTPSESMIGKILCQIGRIFKCSAGFPIVSRGGGEGGGKYQNNQSMAKHFLLLLLCSHLSTWVKTPSLFLTKENINDAALFDSLFLAMFCPLPITQSVSAKPAAAHPFEDYKEKVPLWKSATGVWTLRRRCNQSLWMLYLLERNICCCTSKDQKENGSFTF